MRVNRVRAGLTAALLSAVSLVAAPAGAGGPTSALLSVPGAGSTASLYYTDPEYDELAGLVGMAETIGTFERDEPGVSHESGPGVTITWLIHDIEVWRVDRIYLGGKDGPWISTQVPSNHRSIQESQVAWHQPTDGARLTALLDELGLETGASKDAGFDGVAGAPAPGSDDTAGAPTAAADPEPATAEETTWLFSAGWAAGGLLGGLLGGALLTLAWKRQRATTADDSPSSFEQPDGYAEVLAR